MGMGWVHGGTSSEITFHILSSHYTKFGALVRCVKILTQDTRLEVKLYLSVFLPFDLVLFQA